MKKLLISLFAFSFWILAWPAEVFAQTATLSLDPASGTFNQGCSFSLNINLDTGGAQTDGTDAILIYDPSRFSIANSSIVPNTKVYPDFPGNNVDEAAGKITISGLASVSTPFTGKGVLATLNFTVKDSAPTGATQITFDFDPNNKAKTTDSNVVQRDPVVDILNSVVNGNYIIGTNACGAQASPSPSPLAGNVVVQNPPSGYTGGTYAGGTPSGRYNYSIPQGKTLDQLADKTGKGTGTPELTFTLAIVGGVLTVLGILGLALL